MFSGIGWKGKNKTMGPFIKPEDMNTVQKMKYLSIVSKVCKELETHLGFSNKDVAEVALTSGK